MFHLRESARSRTKDSGTKQNDGSATPVITSKDCRGENVRTSPCENDRTGQAGSVLAVPPRKIHFSCSTTFLLAQFLEHKGSVVSESRALNRRIQFNNSFLSTYKRNRYRTSIFSTSRRGSRPDNVKYRRLHFSISSLSLSLSLFSFALALAIEMARCLLRIAEKGFLR